MSWGPVPKTVDFLICRVKIKIIVHDGHRGQTHLGRICVLAGGGTSSLSLMWQLAQKYSGVIPIFVQSGLRWEECELFWLKKFLRSGRIRNMEPLEVLSLPLRDIYQTHWSMTGVKVPDQSASSEEAYVPGRHILFMTKGALLAAYKKINHLAIGITKEYPYAENHTLFLRQLKHLYARSLGTDVHVLTPFIHKGKEEALFDAKDVGLEYSFSCLNPRGHLHCGECFKCSERKASFTRACITDKTQYYKSLNLVYR